MATVYLDFGYCECWCTKTIQYYVQCHIFNYSIDLYPIPGNQCQVSSFERVRFQYRCECRIGKLENLYQHSLVQLFCKSNHYNQCFEHNKRVAELSAGCIQQSFSTGKRLYCHGVHLS